MSLFFVHSINRILNNDEGRLNKYCNVQNNTLINLGGQFYGMLFRCKDYV